MQMPELVKQAAEPKRTHIATTNDDTNFRSARHKKSVLMVTPPEDPDDAKQDEPPPPAYDHQDDGEFKPMSRNTRKPATRSRRGGGGGLFQRSRNAKMIKVESPTKTWSTFLAYVLASTIMAGFLIGTLRFLDHNKRKQSPGPASLHSSRQQPPIMSKRYENEEEEEPLATREHTEL